MSARRGLPTAVKMRHDVHYVDSLVFREGEVVGRKLPIDQIEANPDQPRKAMGDLTSLTSSVKEHGILEPILVIKTERMYQIISGERRYLAAQQAGLQEVPCIVKNLEPNQILEVALVENIQRKDLHPIEEADGLQTLFVNFSYTHEKLANKIGRSRSSVTETLTLAQLSEAVREAVHRVGITAKSTLVDIAKLNDERSQLALIEKIERGANRREVRQETRKTRRLKPYVYRFRDPQKTFSFQLKFKRSEVSKDELINTLENVLASLKEE